MGAIGIIFVIWGMIFISVSCFMDDLPEFLDKLRRPKKNERDKYED